MQNAIHATPKGAWPSIRGGRYYEHGAPNGAGNIFVAQDTYKVQALPMHSIISPRARSLRRSDMAPAIKEAKADLRPSDWE